MTMRVDVVPFQAMEIAASSPRDLPRFLAGLDDAVLEQVRYYADLVLRAAEASQVQRKFTARWVECGQREPVWPNDTSVLLADTIAAAADSIALPPAPPDVPGPVPAEPFDGEQAPEITAEWPLVTDEPPAAVASAPSDVDTVPDSEGLASE